MTDNLLELAPRPVDLDGATLGVLETQAGDSARYLDLLTARLEKRHFLATVLRFVKPSDREACPTQLLEQLADQCDVVVTGVGQAVETTEFTALDALALERASVPCAVLVSAGLVSAVQQAFAANGFDEIDSIIERACPLWGDLPMSRRWSRQVFGMSNGS